MSWHTDPSAPPTTRTDKPKVKRVPCPCRNEAEAMEPGYCPDCNHSRLGHMDGKCITVEEVPLE